jgi:hypothetical protein
MTKFSLAHLSLLDLTPPGVTARSRNPTCE